jgi:hypothetical protein
VARAAARFRSLASHGVDIIEAGAKPMLAQMKRSLALFQFSRIDRDRLAALIGSVPLFLSPSWFYRHWLRWLLAGLTVEETFGLIYRRNLWGSPESRSGGGSTLAETQSLREGLPRLLLELQASTLLDIPCGDFYWMSKVDLGGISYTGADIVPSLVAANDAAYGGGDRRFLRLDLLKDVLPRADVLLCRECLGHLSNRMALDALRNIVGSGATYLLATTFPEQRENRDILAGEWRPINLELAPFYLPHPLALIREGNSDPQYRDRSLGAWRVADLTGLRAAGALRSGAS